MSSVDLDRTPSVAAEWFSGISAEFQGQSVLSLNILLDVVFFFMDNVNDESKVKTLCIKFSYSEYTVVLLIFSHK